jgi:hypothetical protein
MKINEPVYELNGKPVIRPPMTGEKFIMDGTIIEKVDRVKFLGVWILSNGTNKHHIQKRIQASFAATAKLKKIGFYESNLESKVKASLLQSFVRPSLMYGNEASLLSKEEEKSLCKVEGNILKQALEVSKCSYSTELYHAVGITTLDFAIRKRKMILRLRMAKSRVVLLKSASFYKSSTTA